MTYKTGQRFKAKVCGELATGTIQPMENPKGHWYLLKPTGERWYIGDGTHVDLRKNQVTDLEVLPDADEPVNDRWIELTGKPQEAPDCDMWLLCKNGDVVFSAEGDFVEIGYHSHYMIAQKPLPPPIPSPEKLKREEAEKKAMEFIEESGLLPNASPIYAVAQYILKEKM